MPTQCTCISPSPQRCSNPKSSVLCYTSYGVYRLTVRMHLVAQPRSSWSTIRRQRAQCVTPCAQSLTTSMAYPESAMPLFSAGEASPCICCSAQCTSAVHLRVPPASTDTGQGRPGGCLPRQHGHTKSGSRFFAGVDPLAAQQQQRMEFRPPTCDEL